MHNLTATAQVLCFDMLLVSNGVVPSITPCRLTFTMGGTYEIIYKWLITSPVATAVTVAVRRAGTVIVSETYTLAANSQRTIYSSFFMALNAGDVLDLVASSVPNATVTSPAGLASVFSAKRIGDAPLVGFTPGNIGVQALSCLTPEP